MCHAACARTKDDHHPPQQPRSPERFDRHSLLPQEPIPEGAVWLDLLEPTIEEERAVEAYLGIDVPTREEMKGIEPPTSSMWRMARAS